MNDIIELQKVLDYNFTDIGLLKLALTHRSHSRQNNERMEFVGDGVLDCVIAINLYNRYPYLLEGDLSKIRAALVNQDTLAEIANNINLGQYLILGNSEEKSGGRKRPSILADSLEAVFAAIAFDSTIIQVTKVIERIFINYLDNVKPLVNRDYKSILQEFLQAHRLKLPIYEIRGIDGPEHNHVFQVECIVPELNIKATGFGKNKKEASKIAAEKVLAQIHSSDNTI